MTLRSPHLFSHRVRSIILCVVLLGILSLSLSFKAHASSTIPSAPIATGEASNYPPALSPSPDGNRLYLGWTGTDGHVNITFKNSSDASFPQQNKITLADTASTAPSMATFNNKLYVAYGGTDSANIPGSGERLVGLGIYTGARSLQQFSVIHIPGGNVTTASGYTPPAIVSTNGFLYVAWISGISTLHIAVSNNPQPSGIFTDYVIENVNDANSSPALTISGRTIYVTYANDAGNIEQGTYSLSNPNQLSGLTPPLPQKTNGGPATTANRTGTIWLAFPGTDDQTLCTTTSTTTPPYNGCTQQQTPTLDPYSSPALGSSFGGKVFLAWLEGFYYNPRVINFCQLSIAPGGTCM